MKWQKVPTAQVSTDEAKAAESTSLGDADSQKHEQSTKRLCWQSLISDTRMWEIMAVTFSILCFIAIFCVVRVYDQKPSPSLSYGLTLNAIISILSTAAKSSLIYAVGASLGQLKWLWFYNSDRKLRDIQSFDDATRGPWGSTIMIFQHKALSLASLGATITILALAFDPFFQQILSFPLRQISSTTMFPKARQVRSISVITEHGLDPDPEINSTALKQQTAAYQAFQDALNTGIWSENFPLDVNCPSANCTWPLFKSVGFCSKCADVTKEATLSGCTGMPYGFNAEGFTTNLTKTWSTECTISLPSGQSPNRTIEIIPIKSEGALAYTMNVPTKYIWEIEKLSLTDAGYYQDSSPANTTHLGVKNPLLVLGQAELELDVNGQSADMSLTNSYTGKGFTYPAKGLHIKRVTKCVLSLCSRTHNASVTNGLSNVTSHSPEFGNIWYASRPRVEPSFLQPAPGGIDYEACWKQWDGPPLHFHDPTMSVEKGSWNLTGDDEFYVGDPDATDDGNFARVPKDSASRLPGQTANVTAMDGKALAFCKVDQLAPRLTDYFGGTTNWSGEIFPKNPIWSDITYQPLQGYTNAYAYERVFQRGLEEVMGNIAASLTYWAIQETRDAVNGTAQISEVYVNVHWPWIVLPVVVIVLSLVFLLATILFNRNQCRKLWKNSILPVLYHGLEGDFVGERAAYSVLSQMEGSAELTNVKLQYSDLRGRYMLEPASS